MQDQVRSLGHNTLLLLRMQKYSNGVTVTLPLIPGYLFVRFNRMVDDWKRLAVVDGASEFLGWPGKGPGPVDGADIQMLMRESMLVNGKQVIHPGDLIRVASGKLKDFRASVERTDEEFAYVQCAMFGKLQKLKFRLDEVRRV